MAGKQRFETELAAWSWLDVSLWYGPVVLKRILTRIQDQGYNAHQLYHSVVEMRQTLVAESGQPPLNLPTWEQVAPTP